MTLQFVVERKTLVLAVLALVFVGFLLFLAGLLSGRMDRPSERSPPQAVPQNEPSSPHTGPEAGAAAASQGSNPQGEEGFEESAAARDSTAAGAASGGGLKNASPAGDSADMGTVSQPQEGIPQGEGTSDPSASNGEEAGSSTAGGPFSLQVASYSIEGNALDHVRDLENRGYQARIDTSGLPAFRVWIGTFESRAVANAAKRDFERTEGGAPFVVEPTVPADGAALDSDRGSP